MELRMSQNPGMYLRFKLVVRHWQEAWTHDPLGLSMLEAARYLTPVYGHIYSKPVTPGKQWLEAQMLSNNPLNVATYATWGTEDDELDFGDRFVFCGYNDVVRIAFFYADVNTLPDEAREYLASQNLDIVNATPEQIGTGVVGDLLFVLVPMNGQRESISTALLPHSERPYDYHIYPLLDQEEQA